MMVDDSTLLERLVADRDEAAMTELVRRYLNLVYFAALRQLSGDTHRAQEVAQTVFILLAQKAPSLTRHQALAGWLHATTRYTVSQLRRTEHRRLIREQAAYTMNEPTLDPIAPAEWEQLRPVLDETLNQLSEADREAVLLRFFANQPLAAIGEKLNLSENAARMRVDRALAKLHGLLVQRGVTSTAAALALLLANQAVGSAPAGLAASVTSAALVGGSAVAASGAAFTVAKIFTFMSTSKIMIGIVGAVAVTATAVTWQQRQASSALRQEIDTLRQQSTSQVAALRAENEKILAEKKNGEASANAEHLELLQLRAAREAFRQRQARGVGASAATSAVNVGASSNPLQPGMVPVTALQNRGRDTPRAAAQTMMSAAQQGDTELAASCLTFDPADRTRLEAFLATLSPDLRAKYSTPELLMASVISGSPKPIAGVQLLSEDQPDADTAVQHVQIQYESGELRQDEVVFHRDASGWKQTVSAATVDRVITYFRGKR